MRVGAYQGLLCGAALARPELGLEVRGRVEVATGVTRTAALDSVHANCDSALVCRAHVIGRVGEAALLLSPLARATLKLAAHLEAEERTTAGRPSSRWRHRGENQGGQLARAAWGLCQLE